MTDRDEPATLTVDLSDEARRSRSLLRPSLEADVSVHVFSVSAGLVGVCLTVIGIIRIGININPGYNTIADELLAVNAIIFMAACLLSYSALRSPTHRHSKHFEGYADRLFILGMATMCVAGAIVAFSFL